MESTRLAKFHAEVVVQRPAYLGRLASTNSDLSQATVDGQINAGDVARLVRSQLVGASGEFVGRPKTAKRCH